MCLVNSASGFFTVYVENGSQRTLCGSVNGPLDSNLNYMAAISCNGITGQIVSIAKNNNASSDGCWLLLCDVNVFANPSKLMCIQYSNVHIILICTLLYFVHTISGNINTNTAGY